MLHRRFFIVVFIFTMKCMKSTMTTAVNTKETTETQTAHPSIKLISFSNEVEDENSEQPQIVTDEIMTTVSSERKNNLEKEASSERKTLIVKNVSTTEKQVTSTTEAITVLTSLPIEIMNKTSDPHEVEPKSSKLYSRIENFKPTPKSEGKDLEQKNRKEHLALTGASKMTDENENNIGKREVEKTETQNNDFGQTKTEYRNIPLQTIDTEGYTPLHINGTGRNKEREHNTDKSPLENKINLEDNLKNNGVRQHKEESINSKGELHYSKTSEKEPKSLDTVEEVYSKESNKHQTSTSEKPKHQFPFRTSSKNDNPTPSEASNHKTKKDSESKTSNKVLPEDKLNSENSLKNNGVRQHKEIEESVNSKGELHYSKTSEKEPQSLDTVEEVYSKESNKHHTSTSEKPKHQFPFRTSSKNDNPTSSEASIHKTKQDSERRTPNKVPSEENLNSDGSMINNSKRPDVDNNELGNHQSSLHYSKSAKQEPMFLDTFEDGNSTESSRHTTKSSKKLNPQTSSKNAKSTSNEDNYHKAFLNSPGNKRKPPSGLKGQGRQAKEILCDTANKVQLVSHKEYYDEGNQKNQEVPESKNLDVQGAESKVLPQVEKVKKSTEAAGNIGTEKIGLSTTTLQPSNNTSHTNSTVKPPTGAKGISWRRVLDIIGSVTCVFTLVGGAFYMVTSVM